MTRSIWKGPFIAPCFFRQKYKSRTDIGSQVLEVRARSSTIMPQFVGRKFQVHNGQKFLTVQILEEMVGHKFGEFAFTKKKPVHKKKGKK